MRMLAPGGRTGRLLPRLRPRFVSSPKTRGGWRTSPGGTRGGPGCRDEAVPLTGSVAHSGSQVPNARQLPLRDLSVPGFAFMRFPRAPGRLAGVLGDPSQRAGETPGAGVRCVSSSRPRDPLEDQVAVRPARPVSGPSGLRNPWSVVRPLGDVEGNLTRRWESGYAAFHRLSRGRDEPGPVHPWGQGR